MKQTIRLRFIDNVADSPSEKLLLYKLIARHYAIDETGNPDYIVSCGLGRSHLRYPHAVKILWTGENYVPDFNFFDYAIGFDHLTFGDRYLRMPLYHFYFGEKGEKLNRTSKTDGELLNRKFCSFVVSSPRGNPLRGRFFEELSKYKRVDSGGRWHNNVGAPVGDKHSFISQYKFNICFENSSSPGYTTEKLPQALSAQTLPIYYGNPTVETDFNPNTFIRLRDERDMARAIEDVIRLDQDDEAYLKKVRETCFDSAAYSKRTLILEQFLCNIFAQPLQLSRRRNVYGYQAEQCRRITPVLLAYEFARNAAWRGLNLLHGGIVRG